MVWSPYMNPIGVGSNNAPTKGAKVYRMLQVKQGRILQPLQDQSMEERPQDIRHEKR